MAEPECTMGILNAAAYWAARALLRILGWQIEGELPPIPKYVIVATHTSNWDFVYALLGMTVLSCGFANVQMAWMGKQELFRGLFGPIFRSLGGIAIDRASVHGVVAQSIAAFRDHARLAMLITPQGTRRRRDYWKTGFYYIALGAQVPIVLGYLDYQRRAVGPGPLFTPSGDIEADFATIRQFYQNIPAKFPEQAGKIELPPRAQ